MRRPDATTCSTKVAFLHLASVVILINDEIKGLSVVDRIIGAIADQ